MKVIIDGIEYGPMPPLYSDDTRTLPVLLADIRNVLGWTLAQAGERIGCSVGGLHAIESNRHRLTLSMAMKISRAYGVPLHVMASAAMRES